MDETFVIPVPARVSAVCLVGAPRWIPSDLGEGGLAHVEVVGRGAPPVPWLTGPSAACAGCVPCGLPVDSPLVRRLRDARAHLRVTARGDPRWPPAHLTEAASVAYALAEATGGILADVATGELEPWAFPPEPFDAPEHFAAAEWLGVRACADPGGGWTLATAGLPVLGLPEVRVRRIPDELRAAWNDVLTGVAQRLLRLHWAELTVGPGPAFREVPARFTLSAADVGAAVAGCPHGGETELGLRLDPGAPDGPPTRLTLVAPRSSRASPRPWRERVLRELRR